jgi:hypothetical protein
MNKKLSNLVLTLSITIASITTGAPIALAQDAKPVPRAEARGALVGIVLSSSKAPIGGATVTAISNDGAIRSTVSSSDGIYSFADVPSGFWSLTVSIDGAPDTTTPTMEVFARKATRRDVLMSIATPPKAAPSELASRSPETPLPRAAVAPTVPEALQAPDPSPEGDTMTPWADIGYVGWMNGTSESTRQYSTLNSSRQKYAWT